MGSPPLGDDAHGFVEGEIGPKVVVDGDERATAIVVRGESVDVTMKAMENPITDGIDSAGSVVFAFKTQAALAGADFG